MSRDAFFRQFLLEALPALPKGIHPERKGRTCVVETAEFHRFFQSVTEFPPPDQPFWMVIFQSNPFQFMFRSLGELPLVPGPCQLPQRSVHQFGSSFMDPFLRQFHAFVAGGRDGDPVQIQQLISPQTQDHQHQRIQFPQRPVHYSGQVPVQRPHGLYRSVHQLRSQFLVQGRQGRPAQSLGQSQICISSLEKDLFQYQ